MNGAVTQADRDAAAEYLAGLGEDLAVLVGIRNGRRDDHPLVQAFARHREAETERGAKIAEREAWAYRGFMVGVCKGEDIARLRTACANTADAIAQSIRSTPGDVL